MDPSTSDRNFVKNNDRPAPIPVIPVDLAIRSRACTVSLTSSANLEAMDMVSNLQSWEKRFTILIRHILQVDKVIIAQDSLQRFINAMSPGAYASITKVDFKTTRSARNQTFRYIRMQRRDRAPVAVSWRGR